MPAPTFDQWIDREPRLSYLISTMRRVGCTDMQVMSTMAALAFILEDGKGSLAVTSAELAAAITPTPAHAPARVAPAPVATAPMPVSAAPQSTSTFQLLSQTPEPPKRKPFERALAAVCGSRPGLSVPWNLPAGEKTPKQGAASPKPSRWDRALRKTISGDSRFSMPEDC